jgi:hypothetical protein
MKQIDYIGLITEKGMGLENAWAEGFFHKVSDNLSILDACLIEINEWNKKKPNQQRQVLMVRNMPKKIK